MLSRWRRGWGLRHYRGGCGMPISVSASIADAPAVTAPPGQTTQNDRLPHVSGSQPLHDGLAAVTVDQGFYARTIGLIFGAGRRSGIGGEIKDQPFSKPLRRLRVRLAFD